MTTSLTSSSIDSPIDEGVSSDDDEILTVIPEISKVVAHYFYTTHDREEALQNCITHILLKKHLFRKDGSFLNWSLKLTSNHCISLKRKEKFRKFFSIFEEEHTEPSYEHSEESENEERKQQLHHAIEQLNTKERQLILMCDILHHKDQDVAEIIGITHTSLRVQKHRARKSLKQNLLRMGFNYHE